MGVFLFFPNLTNLNRRHEICLLTRLTIENKRIILAIMICEKYLRATAFFSSEIIYLTIPVHFESCFGEAWMYVMYIYLL